MHRELFFEIALSLIFVFLLVLFLNPFMLWMPTTLQYAAVTLVVLLFALFAGMVWRERPVDEREEHHAMLAGRVAYLFGMLVLVVGVVVQAVSGHVDVWLVLTLAAMVLTKLGMHLILRRSC